MVAPERTSRESSDTSDFDSEAKRRVSRFSNFSTSLESLNAIRHSTEIREKQQRQIENEHEGMVSRLKIRLSSDMRIVEEGGDASLELKSLNHDHGAYGGGGTRLRRIIQHGQEKRAYGHLSACGEWLLWWFAGHPSLRNNQACVIYHGSGFRRLLDTLVAFAALSTSLLVPLDLGFDVNSDYETMRVLDEINTALFIADLFASFLTTYPNMQKDCVVTSHRAIAKRYIRTWFAIDLVAALPLDEMIGSGDEEGGSSGGADAGFVAKLFKMPRLLRAFRLMRLASSMVSRQREPNPCESTARGSRGLRRIRV